MASVLQASAFLGLIVIVGLAFWFGRRPFKGRKAGDNFGESHNKPGESSGAAAAGFDIPQ